MDNVKIYFEAWWKEKGHRVGQDGTARKKIAFEAWKEGVYYGMASQPVIEADAEKNRPDCNYCGVSVYSYCPRCGKKRTA